MSFEVIDSEGTHMCVQDLVRKESTGIEATVVKLFSQEEVQIIPLKKGEPEIVQGDGLTILVPLGRALTECTNEEFQKLIVDWREGYDEIMHSKAKKPRKNSKVVKELDL